MLLSDWIHTLANCLLVQPAVRPSWRQECGRGSEGVRVIAKLHTLIPRARLLLIGPANSRALVMSRMQPRVRRRARNFKRETFISIVQLLWNAGIILITGWPLKVLFKPEMATGFSGMENKSWWRNLQELKVDQYHNRILVLRALVPEGY